MLTLKGVGISCFTKVGISIFQEKSDMVYLKKNSDPQPLFIPRSGEVVIGDVLHLNLENTTDHRTFDFDVMNVDMSDLYFNVSVILPDNVASGEYKYTLFGDGIQLSIGLLIVDVAEESAFTQYQQEIEFTQYERS